MKKNSKLYKSEIHNLIPGGAHTYSKGDDQFPENAPAAISHGKGAYVWDIDGNKFLDCSMGLSSVSLGHAYRPILNAVKNEIDKGVNFQRPSYIERLMAKEFLDLVPNHQMIKFTKTDQLRHLLLLNLPGRRQIGNILLFLMITLFSHMMIGLSGKQIATKGFPMKLVTFL